MMVFCCDSSVIDGEFVDSEQIISCGALYKGVTFPRRV